MFTRLSTIAAAVVAVVVLGLVVFGTAAGSHHDGFVNSSCPSAPGDLSHCR